MKNIDPSAPSHSSPRLQGSAGHQTDAGSGHVDPTAQLADKRSTASDEFDDSSIATPTTNYAIRSAVASQEDDAQMEIREQDNRDSAIDDAKADDASPDSIHSKTSSELRRRRARLTDSEIGKPNAASERERNRNWRASRNPGEEGVDPSRVVPDRASPERAPADDPAIPMPGKRRRDMTRSELLGGLDYSKVSSVTENPQKRRGRSGFVDDLGDLGQDDGGGFFGNDLSGLMPIVLPDGDDPGRQDHMMPSHKGRRNQTHDHNGVPIDESGDLLEQIGEFSGPADRVFYLAMVAAAAHDSLRPPKMDPDRLTLPVGPQSRAECERRCGANGFCDPSDPLGCGGVHCGKPYLDL